MKRSKRIPALAAILALCCIATFSLTKYEEKQENIKNSEAVILNIAADSVQSLSWEYTDTGFCFLKAENGWSYDKDSAFPVSEQKISDILSHFEDFGVTFIIENVEDYGQYGLDKPECTIQLATSEQTYELKLGDFSKMDEQRYVTIGDGNVYLVSEDPMDYLATELSDMILHDDTPSLKNTTDIIFEGAENYTITYAEESNNSYSEDDVYFTSLNGAMLALDTSAVKNYLNTITSLNLQEYVTYNATEEELQSFGLKEPGLSVTVNYTYVDENNDQIEDSCILYISRNPQELSAAEEALASEAAVVPAVTKYVRIGDSQIVYTLDDTDYNILTSASYDDLRHKELFWADFDLVTQIDITLENQTHCITSVIDEATAKRVWYYDETELDISGLQSSLEALSADTFTEESPVQKEEISLTLYLDNESFPQVSLKLYRYDGTFCLAVADGESISLVERAMVVELIETVQTIVLN